MIPADGRPTAGDDSPRVERQSTDPTTQQNPRRGSTLRWVANIGYAGVLVGLAMIPAAPRIVDFSPPDWLAHGVAYGLQSVLLYWAALPTLGHRRSLTVGLVGAASFGAITEALQSLQPTRTVEAEDLFANVTGAMIACGVIVAGRRLLPWGRR